MASKRACYMGTWSPFRPSRGTHMMFDHALVTSEFVPLFGCLVAFFVTIPLVWILLYFAFWIHAYAFTDQQRLS